MTIAERHNPLAPQIDAINSDIAAIETEIMLIRNSDEDVFAAILGSTKRKRIDDLEARKLSLWTRKRTLIANSKVLK
jgi:hypothetical protein